MNTAVINFHVRVLLWTYVFQFSKYLGQQLLNHMVKLGLALSEAAKMTSKVAVITSNEWEFLLFYICCLQLVLSVYFYLFFMFTEAFFITAQTWKQLRCSSTGKKRHKMGYIWVVECHSATKRNELLSHGETRGEPQMHISNWNKPSKQVM